MTNGQRRASGFSFIVMKGRQCSRDMVLLMEIYISLASLESSMENGNF